MRRRLRILSFAGVVAVAAGTAVVVALPSQAAGSLTATYTRVQEWPGSYFQGQYNTQWNLMMAATLISVVPIVILYAVAQKYFIQGIAMTGLKG